MPRPTASRRRTAVLTVSAAGALLVAAPLLTACGKEAHPGAAAVVGGERISMAQLQSRVDAVRDAQRAQPQAEEMIKGSGQLTRATLDGMIRDMIVRRAAKDAGVSVSRREVESAYQAMERQAGGARQLRAGLLQQQAIAPDEIDDRLRMQLTVDKIAGKAGIDPTTQQGNAQLNRELAKTSEKLRIDVNPRYGSWNAKLSTLGNAAEPWLSDVSGRQAAIQQTM